MKHEENCRWEMTTLEECGYRQTHHYCPHPEHACSCVKVPVSDHEPYGTCDWGDCNEEAVRWRYGDQEHGHLPVCYEHSLEAENTRLREQAEALATALEETNEQLERDFAIRCRCDFVTRLWAGIERCVGCRARDRIAAIDAALRAFREATQ